MLISDNEKRDILRFIEAGKPLPDKYRFLLFEDKREVELGPLPNSALKGKAKSLTKLPVDNFAFSFNLPLFLIF